MNIKNKKFLSIVFGVIFLWVAVTGMLQYQYNITKTVSLLKSTFMYPVVAMLDINGFIKDIPFDGFSKEGAKNTPLPSGKKESRSKSFQVLFLLMGAVLLSNEKFLLAVFLIVSAMFCSSTREVFKRNRDIVFGRWKYYLWWCLKFLTPTAKCILNRADEYDINPINMTGRVCNLPGDVTRTLCNLLKVRVFLCIRRKYSIANCCNFNSLLVKI